MTTHIFLKNKNRTYGNKSREPRPSLRPLKTIHEHRPTATVASNHSHPTKSQLNVGSLPPLHACSVFRPSSRMTVAPPHVAPQQLMSFACPPHAYRARRLQRNLCPRSARSASCVEARAPAVHRGRTRCVAGFACGLHQLAGCRRGSLMHGWASCGTRARIPAAKKTSHFSRFCRL